MSHANPSTSSSPNFQLIFNNTLEVYKKRTKNDLLAHPLVIQLQTCTSSSAVLALIHQQLRGLQREDDRLTKWLDSTVRVLYAFSETLGEGVSLVCPGNEPIRDPLFHIHFPGLLSRESDLCRGWCSSLSAYSSSACMRTIVIPSQAAMEVRASQETLIDIFERMETFFQRLEIYTRVSPPPEMIDIIVKIMVEVLSILGIATKEMKQGRISE